MKIIDLGLIAYEKSYSLQRELVTKRRLNEIEDTIILAEHPPIFTIGRSGSTENLLVSPDSLLKKGISVLPVDRGGDITFHGPGQLVLYPIIDLKTRGRDLHKYMRDLEEVTIRLLKGYGITGRRREGITGVWAGDKKIAFIGVACRNWVMYHGLSININNDLSFFSMIHPCGLKGIKVTSMQEVLGRNISFDDVKNRAMEHMEVIYKAIRPQSPICS